MWASNPAGSKTRDGLPLHLKPLENKQLPRPVDDIQLAGGLPTRILGLSKDLRAERLRKSTLPSEIGGVPKEMLARI
jgi:hypothetical protein